MRTLLAILAAGSLVAHIAEDTSDLLQHVKFQSSNFENILTWDGRPESAPDTVYSVQYKTYGEGEWLEKEGCQRITRKSCNLTVETGNLTELYYARVTATDGAGRSATKMTDRFNSLQHTIIKPPDVTCIPKVRSIQMIVHPSYTPIRARNGHQLTLENIFQGLLYRLKLRINHTYQMDLEGNKREFEFVGLTPDTEFLGTIIICIPKLFKESAPYVCQVKTLPDRTWTYSFSSAFLFSMGFLVAGLCYLSYRYITKPPPPPSSLDVQHILPFQPLQFIQEHTLIPIFDLSSSGGLAQPVQYSKSSSPTPRRPWDPHRGMACLRLPTLGSQTSPSSGPLEDHLTRDSPRRPMPPRLLLRAGPRPTHLSDEELASKTEAESPGLQAPDLESSTELDSLFRGLALTVQWES